jgi:hypothetical protein
MQKNYGGGDFVDAGREKGNAMKARQWWRKAEGVNGMAKNQGIKSRNLVHKPVRTGARREHIQKASVAQLGQRQGDHATNKPGSTGYSGVGLIGPKQPISVKLGNEVALNVGKGGPGAGRKVYSSGSQCQTGTPARGNPPPSGELFPGWPAKK